MGGNAEEKVLLCYHCGNKTSMKKVAKHTYRDREFLDYENNFWVSYGNEWSIFFCPVCQNVTIEECYWHSEETGPRGEQYYNYRILYPQVNISNTTIPEKVVKAFESAIKVRHIDNNTCVFSLRKTLELICKDQNAQGTKLYEMLNDLYEKGVLPKLLDSMATLLRKAGNEAAHSDEEISDGLVSDLIDFTQTIIEYIYVLPNKLQKIQYHIEKQVSENGRGI
ncbi:hypothetical protein CBW65_18725 [Tumebacillus avium]|uniref:DUF4145 domain-containing protein n=1 Tax=Tumebacillus avium TaxID=1903704 RepID=A0A1Y0IQS7_9BACL|nr:DUF4145 domain-containing protein [Tumebacillus avium]ARU62777.1 hypothetical protein CBW65_18725 [Tumebacillus avium]